MNEAAPLPSGDLPPSRRLLKSTGIAALVAAVLLVFVVLPAEYGVDPTGFGRILGLTEMGEVKMQLLREAAVADSLEAALLAAGESPAPSAQVGVAGAAPAADLSAPDSGAPLRAHLSELSLDPGEGLEIKLVMDRGATVRYSWTTTGGAVNYDTHADNDSIDYFSYATGNSVTSDEGELVAAFNGSHGWFWRNRGDGVVAVTLRTEGDYRELRLP